MSPSRQKAASDSLNEVATIRLDLRYTDPLIWRQVEVPTSITLKVVHDIIPVMGWFDCNLSEFTGKQKYSLVCLANRNAAKPSLVKKKRFGSAA